MAGVGEIAAEIDRLVVATHENAGARFPGHALAQVLRAHPAIVNGLGDLLLAGPVELAALSVVYPYVPDKVRDALIQNNVDEGVVTVEDGWLVLAASGREAAAGAGELLDESAAEMWADADLSPIESTARSLVAHGATLTPPTTPAAFTVAAQQIERRDLPGRVFRLLSALRYWRADAHRAAWADAGLSAAEAHALNRLWDADRAIDRVGQGDPRPGRTGVAELEERGWAADGAINDLGRKQREAIEADTNARTEPLYQPLGDAARRAFLDGLRQLPIS